MKRALAAASGLAVILAALAFAPGARAADEDTPIGDADLKTLCEKALATAVTSTGKSTLALDDHFVQVEGGATSAGHVAAALRGAGKAKLVKHADDLNVPMLHARFSSLVVATAKSTETDYEVYLEVEAANRQVLHANVTSMHKSGPGSKTRGHHTALTLDSLADGFAAAYFAKPLPGSLTVVGKASSNSIAQQSVVGRLIQRLLAGKAPVVAARSGSVDVERPKSARLLGAQVGLLVTLSNESNVIFVDGSDLAAKVTCFRYHFPPQGVTGGAGAAIAHMKKLATSIEFQFRNNGYRVQPAGPKGKVWVLEAKLETGSGDKLKNDLTDAVRNVLVGHETPKWLFDAKDGETTLADAKAAGIDLVVQPIFRNAKRKNRKEVVIQIRAVANDQVIDEPTSEYTDESK